MRSRTCAHAWRTGSASPGSCGSDRPAERRLRTGAPGVRVFRHQYTSSFEDVALALVRDVVAGRETRGTSPRHAAEQLVALFEGLQLQAMLLDGTDLLAGWDGPSRACGRDGPGAAVTA